MASPQGHKARGDEVVKVVAPAAAALLAIVSTWGGGRGWRDNIRPGVRGYCPQGQKVSMKDRSPSMAQSLVLWNNYTALLVKARGHLWSGRMMVVRLETQSSWDSTSETQLVDKGDLRPIYRIFTQESTMLIKCTVLRACGINKPNCMNIKQN